MYIKSYSCTRFAGLSNVNLEFDRGLNVILGSNESGKSTIINGIHSILFKNLNLKRSLSADKEFLHRYMPRPEGDFIDGQVTLSVEGLKYEISKEWGVDKKIQLITSDGNIIRSENAINKQLSEILLYGEGTYSNIVFAKQRDLKIALKNIMENRDLTDEVNSLLRKAMMELDGISIDNLQERIEEKLEGLYKRWDIKKNGPMNNRGINNPYQIGLGKILESYYEKGRLELLMEEANRTEKRFDEICNDIRIVESSLELLKVKKEELEKIEGDVNKRLILNAELKSINKELDELMNINREWPKYNLLLEQYREKILEIRNRKEELIKERKDYHKIEKKISLEDKLKKTKDIATKIDEITKEIEGIHRIENEDIEKLSKLQKDILTLKTTMTAGVMIGQLKKFSGDKIWIVKDLGEKEKLEENIKFKANGLINIIYEDKFELEIGTGEFDFKEIKNKYSLLKSDEENLLRVLKINSLEEGKLNLERLKELEGKKKVLEEQKRLILDKYTIEELLEEIQGLKDIETYINIEGIEEELESIAEEELDNSVRIRTKEDKIKLWKEKYKDEDNLFNIVIDKRTELKEKENELDKLVSLPKEFNSPEEFKYSLVETKKRFEEYQVEITNLREDYYDAKNELLDISYEESCRAYNEAVRKFERRIQEGEKLQKVQTAFIQTKEALDNNPMESLANEFNRILSLITNNDYKKGLINEEFNISIENNRGEIPIDLLSAGTYDAVTLALRFSLLNHIFTERKGYVILDDCLVDLDPIRKEQSVKLIKDFAKENQVIFTTCDPETASLLGGKVIELE